MFPPIAYLRHIVETDMARRYLAIERYTDFLERQETILIVEGVHKRAVDGSLEPCSLVESSVVITDCRMEAADRNVEVVIVFVLQKHALDIQSEAVINHGSEQHFSQDGDPVSKGPGHEKIQCTDTEGIRCPFLVAGLVSQVPNQVQFDTGRQVVLLRFLGRRSRGGGWRHHLETRIGSSRVFDGGVRRVS